MKENYLEKKIIYYITQFKEKGLDKYIKEIDIYNFMSKFTHEDVIEVFNKIKTSEMSEYFIENGILCFKKKEALKKKKNKI